MCTVDFYKHMRLSLLLKLCVKSNSSKDLRANSLYSYMRLMLLEINMWREKNWSVYSFLLTFVFEFTFTYQIQTHVIWVYKLSSIQHGIKDRKCVKCFTVLVSKCVSVHTLTQPCDSIRLPGIFVTPVCHTIYTLVSG